MPWVGCQDGLNNWLSAVNLQRLASARQALNGLVLEVLSLGKQPSGWRGLELWWIWNVGHRSSILLMLLLEYAACGSWVHALML